jgi:hypothetical protein
VGDFVQRRASLGLGERRARSEIFHRIRSSERNEDAVIHIAQVILGHPPPFPSDTPAIGRTPRSSHSRTGLSFPHSTIWQARSAAA